MTARRPFLGLACMTLLALAFPAHSHRLSPAYFGMTETAAGVFDVEWKVSVPGGLADALEPQVPDGCAVRGRVRSYLVDDARIQHGVIACDGGLAGRTLEVNGLAATDTDVLVRVAFLDGSSFTHRLVPDAPGVVVPERAGALAVASTYLVLGVEHILFGIDHLLFVLALLLLVRGFGRLVATVTAFTVAHSITLGAASLGFVEVPSAPVEATIALSILFLATELARRRRASTLARRTASTPAAQTEAAASSPGRRTEAAASLPGRRTEAAASLPGRRTGAAASPPGRRAGAGASTPGGSAEWSASTVGGADLTNRFPWLVAFSFGLLHGFGFAGALRDVGLPEHAIPLALLFFNVGVEAGQVLFIAAVLALGWAWRRAAAPAPAWWPRAAAYAIGSVAAFWVIERTAAVF